jgi:hypothetical protein
MEDETLQGLTCALRGTLSIESIAETPWLSTIECMCLAWTATAVFWKSTITSKLSHGNTPTRGLVGGK